MSRPKGSKNKKGSSEVKLICNTCNTNFKVKHYRINLAKYCSHKCYARDMKKKHSGSNASHWKGGNRKTWNGYILIYCPNHPFKADRCYIREHRLVMEKQIGRYLKPSEQCHHINGIRTDNRIENLMLFNSISAHRRFEQGGIVKSNEIIFDGRIIH